MRILIADDEQEILEIMARKVNQAGYEVITARDGEQAWNRICLDDPDIILLDLTMPGLHGFEILERLRANPPGGKWQPVIIVSGDTELESVKRGFDLEADHYLTKPCDMAEIIKALELMSALIPQRRGVAE
ncbi:MAG: PleD family two-component system response regulator [Candidatus Omnitrophota bacterium]